MFNSKMKKYNVYTFNTELNDYKEEIKTPVLYKEAELFISLATHNPYQNNSINLTEVTHIGITSDADIALHYNEVRNSGGMMIDNLQVQFVNDAAKDIIVYLKEIK